MRALCLLKYLYFSEAKAVAITYSCKFIETSVVLNLNVDELLVGIVKQLRLHGTEHTNGEDKSTGCASSSKSFLNKIFKKDSISKSCENLYTWKTVMVITTLISSHKVDSQMQVVLYDSCRVLWQLLFSVETELDQKSDTRMVLFSKICSKIVYGLMYYWMNTFVWNIVLNGLRYDEWYWNSRGEMCT